MRKEIKKLREEIVAKYLKIASLESWVDVLQDRVNDLEQKDKKNVVFFFYLKNPNLFGCCQSGIKFKYEGDGEPKCDRNKAVRAFMELTTAMNLKIERQKICNIFQLPKKNAKAPNVTVVKFNNELTKKRIFRRKKSMTTEELKALQGIYINKGLSQSNQELFRAARQLKKEKSWGSMDKKREGVYKEEWGTHHEYPKEWTTDKYQWVRKQEDTTKV